MLIAILFLGLLLMGVESTSASYVQQDETEPPITQITIDGDPSDWVDRELLLDDPAGDAKEGFLDLTTGYAFVNQNALYFLIETVDHEAALIQFDIFFQVDERQFQISWNPGSSTGYISDITSGYENLGGTIFSTFALGPAFEGRVDLLDMGSPESISLIEIAVVSKCCETYEMADQFLPGPTPYVNEVDSPTLSSQENTASLDTSACIKVVADGYKLNEIGLNPLGLPTQAALLPNGEIVISGWGTNSITLVGNGYVQKIISENRLISPAVATLPDGRIAYSPNGEKINLVDPTNGDNFPISIVEEGYISALSADNDGNIYAVTQGGKGVYIYKVEIATESIYEIASELPFEETLISDIDVSNDGTIYVAGARQVLAISADGTYSVIASNLNFEPVWVEISPNGMVYINELEYGLQKFNPETKELISLAPFPAFGDIIAPTDNELLFYGGGSRSYYYYDFHTKEYTPFFINYGNSAAFAAGNNGVAYFSSSFMPDVNDAVLMSINLSGDIISHDEISYKFIDSADFDFDQNLCLATNEGIHCYKNGELIHSIKSSSNFENNHLTRMAAGPNRDWYFITADRTEPIQVYHMNDKGLVTTLPINLTTSSFGGVDKVDHASIDVGFDGQLAIIMTAVGSENGNAYYFQRVYRADANGENLTEIANLDSNRIAGIVDIAISPDNEIYVLNVQDGLDNIIRDTIFRIDENNNVTPFVEICGGHDPESIDVDANGDLWFTTTTGFFHVEKLDE